MNNVTLVGRLARDPELKYTASGTAVVNFAVAVQRRFKNSKGEYEADFIDVVAWRQTAEFIANHFKKGEPIAVQGNIQTRNYENNEGRKIYVTEVVADNVSFVPQPPKNQSRQQSNNQTTTKKKDENPFANFDNDNPFEGDDDPTDISDDDLPF